MLSKLENRIREAFQVKPAPFAYAKARSLDHAIALLDGAPDARVLAGGQSLVAALNMRLSTPSLLVDINGLRELGEISRRNGHIEIGALVRHAQAERSSAIAQFAPLLARAVPHIAHPAIRNRGTIGGSIALADPAAELPACLLALGAEIELTGRTGRRSVAADEFSKGLFETAIEPGDLLTAIRIPVPRSGARFGFAELARRHGDYALVGLAAAATMDGGRLGDARLAFFGVDDRPTRARRAEAALESGNLDAAVTALQHDLSPHSDVHASAAARRHLAGVLLRRVTSQLDSPT
jgi:aerobic carbon-monoxide dehydrogenase medium subunit